MHSKRQEQQLIILDVLMLGLILLNLSLIIFDWFFDSQTFQQIVYWLSPTFHAWYATAIHLDFLLYDLVFVGIFLVELLCRWAYAIYRKSYEYWFMYPIVHWYDVLGCIPIGSFRALRILRIFSIAVRLQKLGYVNFTQTYPIKVLKKYYGILIEEVSDRVVVNAFETLKVEIKSGTPIADELVTQVVLPNKCELVDWLSGRISYATQQTYSLRKTDIKTYVEHLVGNAMQNNTELNNLSKYVPIGGKIIADMIKVATQDIVFNVMNDFVKDIASKENKAIIEDLLEASLEVAVMKHPTNAFVEDKGIVNKILLDAVDLIQSRVEVKQWKVKEEKEKAEKNYKVKQQELETTFKDK